MNKSNGWKQQLGAAALALMLAIGLIGCGAKTQTPSTTAATAAPAAKPVEPQKTEGAKEPAQAAKTVYPLTLKDASGTEVTFDKAPERITSISSSETESVFAIGAGDKVFGVDKFSDYPEDAKKKPQIGDMNTNLEALIATRPDIVLANYGIQKKVVEQLRSMNIKVYADNPKTVDQVIEKTEKYGKMMNLQDNARKVADKMRQEKKQVTDAVKNAPKPKVYIEFSPGWTVGDGEFMNELIELAGGENVGKEQKGWYKIDPEKIIKANPEIILYSKGTNSGMGSILDEVKQRPGFENIQAMKTNKLYPIDDNRISRVGPRITEALIEIGKAIHPDLVK